MAIAEPVREQGEDPVRPVHLVVLILCTLINMLDGYDLLAIAFTAPHISSDWQVSPATLGIVFSAGLAGVGLGSLLLSPVADRFGRRSTILIGLTLVTIGMLGVPLANAVWQLAIFRAVTGLGIGALLSSVNTIIAEYAPKRWRSLAISLYATGYPVGAAISGGIALYIISNYGWRSVYVVGGVTSLLLLPLVAWLLPESLSYLLSRQPRGALRRAHVISMRMGKGPVRVLPDRRANAVEASPLSLFQTGLVARTLLISGAYFCLWFASFFINNWTPTIIAKIGLSQNDATMAGVYQSIGGIAGSILFGIIAVHVPLVRLATAYVLGAFAVALFFAMTSHPAFLMASAGALGFLVYGASVGLYALVPRLFPSSVRATGTGVALATGRLGAVLGLSAGGVLIGLGWEKAVYFSLLSSPLLLAAAAVIALRNRLVEA